MKTHITTVWPKMHSTTIINIGILQLLALLMFAYEYCGAVPHYREKRVIMTGAGVSDALKKAMTTMNTVELASALGIKNVDVQKMSVVKNGSFGAVLRVTLKDKKEFALKVAQSRYFGDFEKAALVALSAKQEEKFSFVTKYLERFSSKKVTVDGNEFETLATVLTGPNFNSLFGENNELGKANFPVAEIRRFLNKLALDLVAMHDDGWCHNDISLGNVAINGETGKQDSYYLIDYGTATPKSETKDGCWKDFHGFLHKVVKPFNYLYEDNTAADRTMSFLRKPFNHLYKGTADADRPMTTTEYNQIKGDIGPQYKPDLTKLLATLRSLAERDNGAKSKLLTAWLPGTNSKPQYAPVIPIDF